MDIDSEFMSMSILFENEEVVITRILQFTLAPIYSILIKNSGEVFDFTHDEIENLLRKDKPINSYNNSESESNKIYQIDKEFSSDNILFENEFIIISKNVLFTSPLLYKFKFKNDKDNEIFTWHGYEIKKLFTENRWDFPDDLIDITKRRRSKSTFRISKFTRFKQFIKRTFCCFCIN